MYTLGQNISLIWFCSNVKTEYRAWFRRIFLNTFLSTTFFKRWNRKSIEIQTWAQLWFCPYVAIFFFWSNNFDCGIYTSKQKLFGSTYIRALNWFLSRLILKSLKLYVSIGWESTSSGISTKKATDQYGYLLLFLLWISDY